MSPNCISVIVYKILCTVATVVIVFILAKQLVRQFKCASNSAQVNIPGPVLFAIEISILPWIPIVSKASPIFEISPMEISLYQPASIQKHEKSFYNIKINVCNINEL